MPWWLFNRRFYPMFFNAVKEEVKVKGNTRMLIATFLLFLVVPIIFGLFVNLFLTLAISTFTWIMCIKIVFHFFEDAMERVREQMWRPPEYVFVRKEEEYVHPVVHRPELDKTKENLVAEYREMQKRRWELYYPGEFDDDRVRWAAEKYFGLAVRRVYKKPQKIKITERMYVPNTQAETSTSDSE